MKAISLILLQPIFILLFSYTGSLDAAENVEDYFSMSPAELAQIPVSIATGTPKTVSKSAAVTSVITSEQIKSMGATQLHEILETVPGMHASLQASTNDYNYSIRGIRNATNSEILFMLNGTRVTTPFRGTLMTILELPTEAIQQIEVIRGPGSALYGADAFAGVINIITKKAKDIDGTTLAARVGDHGTQSGWGQYGAQFSGWELATSLQYQHSKGDSGRIINADSQTGYDKFIGTQASNAPGAMNTNYETLNGHLNLQRKHWDLGFWAFNDLNSGVRAGVAGALDPNGSTNAEQYLGDLRFSTEDWFEDWEFIGHLSYLYADFKAKLQLFPDNAKLPIGSDGNIKSPLSNVPLVSFPDGVNDNLGRIENIPAFEFNMIYRGWSEHLLRFSMGFRHEQIATSELKNYGSGVIDGSIPVIGGALKDVTNTPLVYLVNRQRSIWSSVLQDEWQLADDWQLTVGVRYDHYSDFGNTVNPRAALVWNINKQLTNKLMYGKAYRAPSFSEQGNQNNPVLLGNKNLGPETIHTVEWALDFHPSSVFRTAFNLYYYQIQDLIEVVPDQGKTTASFQNRGQQTGYGTEFEWNWQALEQVNIMGNYAWQNARNDLTKRRVESVPEHHTYIAAAWQFIPQWQFQSQLNLIAGRTTPLGDNRALNDYQTIDFTLRGKKLFGQVNTLFSLRNAFDTTYRELATSSFSQNLPMPGRSFYVEVSINF